MTSSHATAPRLRPLLVLALLATACGTAAPSPASAPTALPAPPDRDGGRVVATLDLLPEEVDALPATAAADPAALEGIAAALVPHGLEEGALDGVDLDAELVAVFDLGECAVGDAVLAVEGADLTVDGVTSDGVCDAIDHQVQVWAVPWDGLPAQVTVGTTTVTRPG